MLILHYRLPTREFGSDGNSMSPFMNHAECEHFPQSKQKASEICSKLSSPPLNPEPSMQIAQESTWAEKHTAFINLSLSQFFDSF